MSGKKKFILVGTGGFGAYWCETIIPRVSEFAQIVAAVDINPDALGNAIKFTGLNHEHCYTNLTQAIRENEADFIVIVVPPEYHESIIDSAIEAGLDIVCEKPLGESMESSVRIYKKIKATGRKLVVTMSHRYEVEKQTVEALVKSNIYGKLNYIVSRLTTKRQQLMHSESRGAPETMISSGLIHNLDTVRGICGCNAKSVYANCWYYQGGEACSNSPSGLVVVEMENGVRAVFEESFANATTMNGWSDEYLRAECANATIIADKRKVTVESHMGYPYPEFAKIQLLRGTYWDHALIIKQFTEWLCGGNPPPTFIEDNIQCCALTFAAMESSRTGKAIDVQEYLKKYIKV
jgi:predicted dehydrogenase